MRNKRGRATLCCSDLVHSPRPTRQQLQRTLRKRKTKTLTSKSQK
jgi:hypothetical protein